MESANMTTQQLMFSLIEVWKGSGKSQKEFCQEKELAYHRFHYWHRKYMESQAEPVEPFMAVTVRKRTDEKRATVGSMEILWPDGRRLIFHQGVDASFLRTLLS